MTVNALHTIGLVVSLGVLLGVSKVSGGGGPGEPCCLTNGECALVDDCRAVNGILVDSCTGAVCVGCCEGFQLGRCEEELAIAACAASGGTPVTGAVVCSGGSGNEGICINTAQMVPAMAWPALSAVFVLLLGGGVYHLNQRRGR